MMFTSTLIASVPAEITSLSNLQTKKHNQLDSLSASTDISTHLRSTSGRVIVATSSRSIASIKYAVNTSNSHSRTRSVLRDTTNRSPVRDTNSNENSQNEKAHGAESHQWVEIDMMETKQVALALSDCGKIIAVAQSTGRVILYCADMGKQLKILQILPMDSEDRIVSLCFETARTMDCTNHLFITTIAGSLFSLELDTNNLPSSQKVEICQLVASLGKVTAESQLLSLRVAEIPYLISANHNDEVAVWSKGGENEERGSIKIRAAMKLQNWAIRQMRLTNDFRFLVLWLRNIFQWMDWLSMVPLFNISIDGVDSFALMDTANIHELEDTHQVMLVLDRKVDNAARLEVRSVVYPNGSSITATTNVLWNKPKFCETEHHLSVFPTFQHDRISFGLVTYQHGRISLAEWAKAQPMNEQSLPSTHAYDQVTSLTNKLKMLTENYDYGRGNSSQMASIVECAKKCFDMIGIEDGSTQLLIARLYEFLHFVHTHLEMPTSDELKDVFMDCCEVIHAGLHKWSTFQLLRSCFAESNNMRAEWLNFYKCNIHSVLNSYLRFGAMRAVKILWNRHSTDISGSITAQILTFIPTNVRVHDYLDWLTQDVLKELFMQAQLPTGSIASDATVTSTNSPLRETYRAAITWCTDRATSIASQDGYDDAIRLIDGFLSSLPIQIRASFDMDRHTCFVVPESIKTEDSLAFNEIYNMAELKKMKQVREQLYHVKYLAEEHGYALSFTSLAVETPTSIAMSMLDRATSPQMIRQEMKHHVRIYLSKYKEDCDRVLEEYIAEANETDAGMDEDIETRVVVLLDEIENQEKRMAAALKWFRGLKAPYSNIVQDYARGCCLQESNQKNELQEAVRLMNIQEMLYSYGIGSISMTDTKHMPYVISHILGQVERPSALADGICLIDASIHLNEHYRSVAIVEYLENLLYIVPMKSAIGQETRTSFITMRSKAIEESFSYLEKNCVSLQCIGEIVDEVIAFGLNMLERVEKEQEDQKNDVHYHVTIGTKMETQRRYNLIPLMEKIVSTYLNSCQRKSRPISAMSRKATTRLLRDLQRLQQMETEYGILLSVSTLKNKEKCERYIAQCLKLRESQIERTYETEQKDSTSETRTHLGNGKRKMSHQIGIDNQYADMSKRQRLLDHEEAQTTTNRISGSDAIMDERRVQLSTELRRFALLLGLESHDYDTLIAKHAAQSGFIGQALQYARELFSLFRNRVNYYVSWNGKSSRERGTPLTNKKLFEKAASTLQQISFMISAHEAHCVNQLPQHAQRQSLNHVTALSDPHLGTTLYSMEVLTYTACVCEIHSLAECILLYRNAVLVNSILQYATLSTTARTAPFDMRLYTQWFRDDTTVLPYAQGMRLATQYAIQEHKIFMTKQCDRSSNEQEPNKNSVDTSLQSVTSGDLLPSKRLVSFLLGQNAHLLALRVILSMQIVPIEAQAVLQSEKSRLLSTVFQSERIDRVLSLGLMLTMEQSDAFECFRSQITKENVVKDYTRFQQLAIIGSDAARAWQQIGFLQNCVDLEANARWWHCFSLLGISCEPKAFLIEKRDIEYLKRLVPELMKKSNLDLLTVLEFTRQYHIDDNYPLLVYVEELLLLPDGTKYDYQSLIVGVLDDIHAQYLQPVLSRVIPNVSGLDYSRLEFIYQLLLDRIPCSNQAEITIRLQVLRLLKLQSKAKSKEQFVTINFHKLMAEPCNVLGANANEDNFEIIAAIGVLLQVDTDKLNMVLLQNTVKLAQLSRTATDDKRRWNFARFEKILINSVSPIARASAAQWLAEQLANDVEKLKALNYAVNIFEATEISIIKSENSKETTLVSELQSGQLKKDVIYYEIKILMQKLETRKLESMMPNIMKDVRRWIDKPRTLFVELYRQYFNLFHAIKQSSMLHRIGDVILDKLKLANEKLQLHLVQLWLTEDAVRVCKTAWDYSEAFSIGLYDKEPNIFTPSADEEYDDRDQELVEKIYSIVSWVAKDEAGLDSNAESNNPELVEIIEYLFNFVKETRARAGVTSRAKMRAARILLLCTKIWSVGMRENASAGTNMTDILVELKTYLRYGRYMIVLEEHRVPIDSQSFIKMDKTIIVESLLRRHEENGVTPAWALNCASEAMLDFDIDNASLWYRTLKLLTEKQMFKQLLSLLVALSGKSIVQTIPDAYTFWEVTLHSPLTSLLSMCKNGSMENQFDFGSDEEEIAGNVSPQRIPYKRVQQVLEDVVQLLRTCPFLERIDIPKIIVLVRDIGDLLSIKKFHGKQTMAEKLNLNLIAVRIAIMIPRPRTRYEALVQIIKAGAYQSVLDEMIDTAAISDEEQPSADTGTSGSSGGLFQEQLALLHVIFTEAVSQGYHQAILKTPFKQSFLEFIASTNDIEHTLTLLLCAKEFDCALCLVEMHSEQKLEKKTMETIVDEYRGDVMANCGTLEAGVSKWQPLLDFVSRSKSKNLLACLETLVKQMQPTLIL